MDDGDRQRFLDILLKKRIDRELAVYAYCLMDNHAHLVLREDRNEISTIMKGIATSYAMFFNIKYSRVGHVFQDRFRSEPITDERYLWAVIRYIHNNPIKAGIANEPNQYKWSSYNHYVDPVASLMVDSRYILEMISVDLEAAILEFKRFSEQTDDVEYIDDEEVIRTLAEGLIYLNAYLASRWPGVEKAIIINDKILCSEIIHNLRTNTNLSLRKIAELLGIHRRVVERLVSK